MSTEDTPPLNLGSKLSFGIGQIAEGVKTCAFGTYLLFYYNQILGLSGDLAGLAIFIALVFDADASEGAFSPASPVPLGLPYLVFPASLSARPNPACASALADGAGDLLTGEGGVEFRLSKFCK